MTHDDDIPPADIIEASDKVARWFAERNIEYWVLGECASRTFYEDILYYEGSHRLFQPPHSERTWKIKTTKKDA